MTSEGRIYLELA